MQKRFPVLLWLLSCCLVFLLTGPNALAQKKKIADKNNNAVTQANDTLQKRKGYMMMGRYFGASIVLRWAPVTAQAWERGNTAGYRLYRFEFNESEKNPLSNISTLLAEPLKPLTLEEWKRRFKQDDTAAAIAAELLYGNKFETSVKKTGQMNWGDAYTQAIDRENRLGYALMNADIHPAIAEAMAWRWEDKTVSTNKLYAYVLVVPATATHMADTISVLVSTRQPYRKPEMLPVAVMPWDRTVTLYWNKKTASQLFGSYYIERSDDNGKSFHRLNGLPWFSSGQDSKNEDWIHYTDSLPKNYLVYKYRVTGLTAFGETSIPSPEVTTSGLDKTAPSSPLNVKAENTKGSEVKISWQKPVLEKDLAGFLVGRGHSADGPFFPLDTVLLPASTQSFTDPYAISWDKNFYIVAAVDTAGNTVRSLPAYAIIRDTIPPASPNGLTGNIDSAGRVHLSWNENKEPDIEGYNVYVSNNGAQAFYALTPKHIDSTNFTDSVTLLSLTRHVYYRVCAFDKAGNPGPYSRILELTKPDIVPPVSPVFNRFLVTDSSVTLQWAPSSSEDVAALVVWRREKNATSWVKLDSIEKTKTLYTDHKVERLKEYEYSLTAIDSSGLSSGYAFPLQARIYDNGKRKEVDELKVDITADQHILLAWKYNLPDRLHVHFILYRNYNNQGLEMYRNVNGDQDAFTDTMLPGKGNYQYALKVVTDDGGASRIVTSQTIQYEKKEPKN